MAIDELLLTGVTCPILRFYGWSRPTVTIGYFQPYSSAHPGEHVIIRRPSGGGVVDHRDDFTFSLVFPATHELFQIDRFESYRIVNQIVADALNRLGFAATLTPDDIPKDVDRAFLVCFDSPAKFDVLVHGRKACGGAQRRRQGGMLHQGSISTGLLRSTDHQSLGAALLAAFETTLGITFALHPLSESFLSRARALAKSRYASESWNRKK